MLLVSLREIVGGMRRPLVLPNDLAVERQVLLAEELEDRRHVDELDAVALRGADDALIAAADVRAACFGRASRLAHRMNAAADAPLRLEHEHAEADAFERRGGVQAREARADDDDVEIGAGQRGQPGSSEGSSTPQSAGFSGPGRPGRQQSAGQRS